MSKLYLLRHGQTLFNVLRRKQGSCDSPLTDLGREQAARAGAWLRESGVEFDHLYSSSSERACDTLEIALPGRPYERLKGLKERGFGVFEGLTEDTNIMPPYGEFYVQFGGEGDVAFSERIMSTLTGIMDSPEHETVLAATHGAFCAQALRLAGYEIMEHGAHLGNCAICVFDYDAAAKTFSVDDVVNPLD